VCVTSGMVHGVATPTFMVLWLLDGFGSGLGSGLDVFIRNICPCSALGNLLSQPMKWKIESDSGVTREQSPGNHNTTRSNFKTPPGRSTVIQENTQYTTHNTLPFGHITHDLD